MSQTREYRGRSIDTYAYITRKVKFQVISESYDNLKAKIKFIRWSESTKNTKFQKKLILLCRLNLVLSIDQFVNPSIC